MQQPDPEGIDAAWIERKIGGATIGCASAGPLSGVWSSVTSGTESKGTSAVASMPPSDETSGSVTSFATS